MKITLDLNLIDTGQDYLSNDLTISSFKDFSVNGLPDEICGKYSVDDCIIIQDNNIKTITSNNTDVIDLKIFKSKNIFKPKPTIYKVFFKKLGNGSLTILHKNSSKRSFGIFLDSKKDVMKFGSILEIGDKYEKFWEKWHVDILYTNEETDILTFVKKSLKKGSIPAIKITTQKNNLEKTIKECLVYLERYCVHAIFVVDVDQVDQEYHMLVKKYKSIKFCVLLDMEDIKYNLDYSRSLTKFQSLQLLNKEAMLKIETLKKINIKTPWLIGFTQNKSDALNPTIVSLKFNNDLWLSYLYYIKVILKELQTEGMIYNIPTGLLNNHTNTKCDYEDGSTIFFFGGNFNTKNLFYKENIWKDKNLHINSDDIKVDEHLDLCLKNGIRYLFFGSSLNTGTTANYSPYSLGKVMDREYLVKSIKNYKQKFF